jgi:hypothetical protein
MPLSLKSQVSIAATLFFIVALSASCASNAAGGQGDVRIAAAESAMTTLGASAPAPIRLGDSPVRVPLALGVSRDDARHRIAGRHVELVLTGIKADRQPGITYRVYFGLAPGAQPDDAHFVETINFFNDVALTGATPKPDQPRRFDITGLAVGALNSGADLSVTLVPEGRTQNGAQPEIGHIAVVVK